MGGRSHDRGFDGRRASLPFGAVALAIALGFGCGGNSSPANVVTPRPSPAPRRTPEPVGSVPCDLGNGAGNASCRRQNSALAGFIEAAIDALLAQEPALFRLDEEWEAPGTRQYRVLDKDAYLAGVLHNLRTAGLCADLDYTTMELVQVKNTNAFSEDFDVYADDGPEGGYIRRDIGGSYRKTCTPASFPVAPAPGDPPPGSGCFPPYPPPITRFNARIYVRNPDYWTLDSTPIIGPDASYCGSVGYRDGRSFCPVRPDGAVDRVACENFAVGVADDNGLPGPTWKRDGAFCTGPESGCAHHVENVYQLLIYPNGPGMYTVCADNGICGEVYVDR